jgi:inosine/guanosine/xanthosine phosphorylase family protein
MSARIDLDTACAAFAARSGAERPQVAMVLGSGLGGLADHITDATRVSFADVPGMASPGVEGHRGQFVVGKLGSVSVIAMQGRVHLYEGHEPERVVHGVRVMAKLGARALIVTNAAGGIAPTFGPGTLMLIDDHINLTGRNPLVGANDAALGPRFPDMTSAYDPELSALCLLAEIGRAHV